MQDPTPRQDSETRAQEAPAAHQRIPRTMLVAMGLCLVWFAPVGWLAYWGHVDTVLTMLFVSVFVVVALGVPWLLVRTSRGRIETVSADKLPQGLRGTFETYTGRVSGRAALVQIMLPLASAAIAITSIGIVLAIVSGGASSSL